MIKLVYTPWREQSNFSNIDWIANIFCPLFAAGLLGEFTEDYLTRCGAPAVKNFIIAIMLILNDIVFVLKFVVVIVLALILAWKILNSVRSDEYRNLMFVWDVVLLTFLFVLVFLYLLDKEGSYIFGHWNKLSK